MLTLDKSGQFMYRILYLLIVLGLLQACSNIPQYKGFIVDGVSFVNQTNMALHDVTVSVKETGGVVSCGFIPVAGDCAVGFPVRQYHGQAVNVSWKQGGQYWETGEFIVLPDKLENPSRPANVRVLLNPQGDFSVQVLQ
ncbi:MAG: hypothetical protein R3312_07430 [Gammaproteobacteria bacterium]|nr:hypothetical protein [Gammaproteobacteria bacterium]